jgi:hypothetical protein
MDSVSQSLMYDISEQLHYLAHLFGYFYTSISYWVFFSEYHEEFTTLYAYSAI